MGDDEEGDSKCSRLSGSSQSTSYNSAKMSLQHGSKQTLYKSLPDISESNNANKNLVGNGLNSQNEEPESVTEIGTTEIMLEDMEENCDLNGQGWGLVKYLIRN